MLISVHGVYYFNFVLYEKLCHYNLISSMIIIIYIRQILNTSHNLLQFNHSWLALITENWWHRIVSYIWLPVVELGPTQWSMFKWLWAIIWCNLDYRLTEWILPASLHPTATACYRHVHLYLTDKTLITNNYHRSSWVNNSTILMSKRLERLWYVNKCLC